MGRSKVSPIQQPTDFTCGPVSLKLAMAIFNKRISLEESTALCRTTRNGTSTKNLIMAFNKLGIYVLAIEYATLRHLRSALSHTQNKKRAILVSYLYDLKENEKPHPDSGHWAVVSSYRSDLSRIILLDSASAQKKSYAWNDFRERWIDYDLKRRKLNKRGRSFQMVKSWWPQLLLVVSPHQKDLPKFKITTQKLFSPAS
jgi:ABC-type bacteriocin/lantibiotic exporter with double-glycine peptidase domain